MVKTRSTSGGAGSSSSSRRLLKSKRPSSSSSSPAKTVVSRGSQTTLSELRRDLAGVTSSASTAASAASAAAPHDLSGYRFPPELSVELCTSPEDEEAETENKEPEQPQPLEPQPSTSRGLAATMAGRKRRAASANSGGDPTENDDCDTPNALGLSNSSSSSSIADSVSRYASNVSPADPSARGTAMNKKFLTLGEPSKKRRRSSSEIDEDDAEEIRRKRRRRRYLEIDDEDEDEEDVNNVTDDEEFWSDVDGDVVGRNEDEEDEEGGGSEFDGENPPGDRVAHIHVGEGGEADLEAQLKGAENLNIQILEEEDLPDIDETDMIHGLDHTGTARDYVDERHRCTSICPVGCQGHLRPNEIVIYESFKWKGKLRGRRRYDDTRGAHYFPF